MLTGFIYLGFGFSGGFCECSSDHSIPLKVWEFLGDFCYFWLFSNTALHVDSTYFIRKYFCNLNIDQFF
jgi:hypothetical protein